MLHVGPIGSLRVEEGHCAATEYLVVHPSEAELGQLTRALVARSRPTSPPHQSGARVFSSLYSRPHCSRSNRR